MPACTSAPGSDGSGGTGEESEGEDPPTWHQDVAPLVVERCSGCHRSGGIAPFSVETYDTAKGWAPLMSAAVDAGIMPPWGAKTTEECAPPHPFKDDPTLSDEERDLLRAWAEAGAPEGDPATAAELPEPPALELENPDQTLPIPTPVEIAGEDDQFYCFVVDPEITDTAFLAATQINPGNDRVVHHVLVYSTTSAEADTLAGDDGYYECFGGIGVNDTNLIAAWAPGAPPNETPPNAPIYVEAGSKLIINVHYHPTGSPETDADTSIDLKFYDGLPEFVSSMALIGNFSSGVSGGQGLMPGPNDAGGIPQFVIPPNEPEHTEEMIWTATPDLPEEMRLWMVGTHMHYVGTDMLIGLQRGENSASDDDACLVQTPQWDFNWQRGYSYDIPLDEAPIMRPGDLLYMRCSYDNTLDNPFVAEALAGLGLSEPQTVVLGEETLDEMCLGVFGIAVPITEFLP